MGILDSIRQLFGGAPEGLVLPSKLQAESRAQHYMFAHRALPAIAAANPVQTMRALMDNAEPFLLDVWNDCGRRAAELGGTADRHFRPKAPLRRVANQTAWFVVTMPQPMSSPEAFFVALGFKPGATAQDWSVSVFTLELSLDFGKGRASLVLGGWDRQSHSNYGPVELALTEEAFLERCIGAA